MVYFVCLVCLFLVMRLISIGVFGFGFVVVLLMNWFLVVMMMCLSLVWVGVVLSESLCLYSGILVLRCSVLWVVRLVGMRLSGVFVVRSVFYSVVVCFVGMSSLKLFFLV